MLTVYVLFSMLLVIIAYTISLRSLRHSLAISPILAFSTGSLLFINSGFVVYSLKEFDATSMNCSLLVVSIGLLITVIGEFIGDNCLRLTPPRESYGASVSNVSIDISYNQAVQVSILVFIITLTPFVYYGKFPLLESVNSLSNKGYQNNLMNTARNAVDPYANSELDKIPLSGFFDLVRYFGLPIIFVWFMHFLRIKKGSIGLSIVILLCCALLIMMKGQRWPLMYLLSAYLIYYSWVQTDRVRLFKNARRVAVAAIVLGVVLSALLGRKAEGDQNPLDAMMYGVHDLVDRILFGNVNIPFQSYSLFPDRQGFLYGWSFIQNLWSFIPGHPLPSYPVAFYQLVTGDDQGFTAPPDFYTESYINFGILGTICISFLAGFLLAVFNRVIAKCKTLTSLSYSCLFVSMIAFMPMSGLTFLLGAVVCIVFIDSITRLTRYSPLIE